MPDAVLIVLMLSTAILVLMGLILMLAVLPVWIRSLSSGCFVSLTRMLRYRASGYPISMILDAWLLLKKTQAQVAFGDVAAAYKSNKGRVRSAADLAGVVQSERPDGVRGTSG